MRSKAKFEKRAGQFHSSREAWAKVNPPSFASGSMQQAVNVLHCAVEDIEQLHAERAALLDALRKSAEGWGNVVEFGLLPPSHRSDATVLRDGARAAIAKATGAA